jgi:hypothetical protein
MSALLLRDTSSAPLITAFLTAGGIACDQLVAPGALEAHAFPRTGNLKARFVHALPAQILLQGKKVRAGASQLSNPMSIAVADFGRVHLCGAPAWWAWGPRVVFSDHAQSRVSNHSFGLAYLTFRSGTRQSADRTCPRRRESGPVCSEYTLR